MSVREFHLGDVLSVTTGILVSPRKLDGLWELLDHMTGESLFTHQLPRAFDECAPELLCQHPDLAAVAVPELEPEQVLGWLAEQVAVFGEYRSVRPLATDDHTRIDPISELRMMRPDAPIIPIVVTIPTQPDKGGDE